MQTATINENRKTYFRRNVIHACASGMLFRAPDDTLATKGCAVYLLSVEMEGEEPTSALVQVSGQLETWLPWPEGKEQGEKTSERKVYRRRAILHFCAGKGRLYRLPVGIKAESVRLLGEPTDAEAIAEIDGEPLACARWSEGESKKD